MDNDNSFSYNDEMRLKPYKREFLYSYSCGVFPTCELATKRPGALRKIVVTDNSLDNEGVRKLKSIASQQKIPFVVDNKTVERIYPKDNVYAVGVFDKFSDKLDKASNHIVLCNPSDMGNLGTIIRTMVAFEIFDLCLIKQCCDVFDPKTVRSSMGAIFRLRLHIYDTFEEYFNEYCKESNRELFPFMLNGKPLSGFSAPKDKPFSLIMGNEAAGLPKSFENVGTPVRIMHADTVDSLNLPIATAMGIFWARGDKY